MGRPGHILKEAARLASKGLFAAADPFFGAFPGPRLLIYHQIEAGLGRQMEVTKKAFTAQLDWLTHNGAVASLDDAITARGSEESDRTFVLTFDDGYDDFYRHGFPQLVARGLPFVLYLTTHPVETGEALFPGGGAEPVTWAHVDEMLASGLMTLGAHTHTHLDLRTASTDEVEDELGRSDDIIRARTSITPIHFAYPWGYWSRAADGPVRARYATATLGSGPAITSGTDPLLLNRVPVQLGDGVFFFKRKMKTGLRLEDKVRRRLVGYRGP